VAHSAARRVARNTVALLMGSAGRMLLSTLLQVLVARQLGAVGLGKYTLMLALVSIFQTVSELGLPSLTIREAARARSALGQYFYAAGTLQLIASGVAWAGMVGLGALLGYPQDTRLMLLIGGASLIPYAIVSATFTILQAQERMVPVAAIDIAGVTLNVLINAGLLWLGFGVIYLAGTLVVTQSLAAVAALWVLASLAPLRGDKRSQRAEVGYSLGRPAWYPGLMRALLSFAPEFFLLALSVVAFSRLDVLALSRLRGEAEVGVYTAAFLIVNAANLAFISYGNAIYPRLAHLFTSDPGRFSALGERISKHALILSLPVAVGGMLLADQIIALIYHSAQYAHSAAVLRLVVWYAVPFALNAVLSRLLLSSNRQRQSVYVAGAKLAFALIAYLVLIPPLGVIGAALATVLSAALGTVMNWLYVARYVVRLRVLHILARPGLAALGMAAVLLLLRTHVAIEIICGAAVYVALTLVLGGLDGEDLGVLRGLWSGRPATEGR